MFRKLFSHTASGVSSYHVQCSYNVAWTIKTLVRPSLHALLLGPLLFSYGKWGCLLSLLFSFKPLNKLSTGESESLHDVGLLAFWIFVYCSDTSSFSFIDVGYCFLLVVVPSDTEWQAHQSAQNERRNANDTVTKKGARVVTKLCWLATRQSGGWQLLLQLSPCLEGAVKTFHFMDQNVPSTVMIWKNDALY